ncbi:MAG: type II toxin-antitoxin system VapC family toxin [Gallionella sp.]
MKALDTNVLVRFLVNDDEKQARMVCDLLRQAETERALLFVPSLVMLELIWVLESVYDISRENILGAIHNLLMMPVLSFDKHAALQSFMQAAKNRKEGLADLFIACAAIDSGCSTVLTFDKKALGFKYFQLLNEE